MKRLALVLFTLLGCGAPEVGMVEQAVCRTPEEHVLWVSSTASCLDDDGTVTKPFCDLRDAVKIIQDDTCEPLPWTLKLLNQERSYGWFELNAKWSGDKEEYLPKTVVIEAVNTGGPVARMSSSNVGSDGWTPVHIGSGVNLTIDGVWIINADGSGVDCDPSFNGRGRAQLTLRNMSFWNIRGSAISADDCDVKIDNVHVDHSFGGALNFWGRTDYDIKNFKITNSASNWPLLQFDNASQGRTDGIIMRNNLTSYIAIDCGYIPRTLRGLDIIHHKPIFSPDYNKCLLVNSTIKELDPFDL